MNTYILLALFTLIVLWTIGSYLAVRNLEEPKYEVVEKRDGYEIRKYSPYIVAETEVSGNFSSALNQGFSTIADYIFGNNVPAEKLAMTVPVTQQQDKQTIAMTAPVTQQSGQDGMWKIRFTMPAKYTLDTIPKPKDDRIKLIDIEPYKAAVIRFSGTSREKNFTEHKDCLLYTSDAADE